MCALQNGDPRTSERSAGPGQLVAALRELSTVGLLGQPGVLTSTVDGVSNPLVEKIMKAFKVDPSSFSGLVSRYCRRVLQHSS